VRAEEKVDRRTRILEPITSTQTVDELAALLTAIVAATHRDR
jgi:hypothetical protein